MFDGRNILVQCQCPNEPNALNKTLAKLITEQKLQIAEVLACAEYTGMYIYPLTEVCVPLALPLWLQHPAEIKRSIGVQRGKNDAIDARRIAYYACRFADKAQLYVPKQQTIKQLYYLDTEREMLVTDRAKYIGQLKDQGDFMPERNI